MAENGIPEPAPATRALLSAYLQAAYVARLDGTWLPLRIGQPAPAALERALPGGWRTLVTAWNPRSVPRDEARNRRADLRLQADLDALQAPRLPACGGDASGHWREEGWLAAGLGPAQADALARRHGQAAILHWRAGEAVRLRMYLPRPAEGDLGFVDWAEG
ncbi:MAG TPA: DUF3293 domain-containing protein [Pseudoxanthomonas sp.]|nr:DUF3293 domain-containing protein [Pseudoxanthomonas sp.]